MSATERLLTNIREYTDLLQFLDQKYPNVLQEFKILNAGLPGQQETDGDGVTIIPGLTRDDSQEYSG